jgi:hypothetical protein
MSDVAEYSVPPDWPVVHTFGKQIPELLPSLTTNTLTLTSAPAEPLGHRIRAKAFPRAQSYSTEPNAIVRRVPNYDGCLSGITLTQSS